MSIPRLPRPRRNPAGPSARTRADTADRAPAPARVATPASSRHRRLHASVAAGLLAILPAVGLSACSSNPDEQSCGDYLSQSDNDQRDTARTLLDEHGHDKVPDFLVPAAQGSLIGYCNVQGDDATLGDAFAAFESALQPTGQSTGTPTSEPGSPGN